MQRGNPLAFSLCAPHFVDKLKSTQVCDTRAAPLCGIHIYVYIASLVLCEKQQYTARQILFDSKRSSCALCTPPTTPREITKKFAQHSRISSSPSAPSVVNNSPMARMSSVEISFFLFFLFLFFCCPLGNSSQ